MLACTVLPRSAVTLCTSPLAKPVVSIWFTPLGPAPLSLRPFAWSFRVFTLCCSIVIVYQSRSLRLKICGKKLSDCSIAGFRVRFQPAVVLGVWTWTQRIRLLLPSYPKSRGWSLSLNTMLRSTQDLWFYGVPTMLLRSLKLIGKASRSALVKRKTGLLANIGRGWCRPTGNLSPQWSRMGGMTGTWHLDTNWIGAHSILWSYYEHLPAMGGCLVTGGRMDYTYYIFATQRRVAKARTSEGSYLSFDQRSVPMLMWGRACFEQGSLPSLLALPGDASLLVLPGDGMFQAQRIVNGKCRPVILHGYGGAKKEMPTSLATLARFGWIPMATAMVGSASSPPLWAGNDWRPILGTSVDTRILPPPLSDKESLLLLSQWIRLPRDDLHIRHATNSWLQPGKVNIALGPDCDDSPHPIRELPLDLGTAPYLAMLFGPQKADQGHPNKTVKQEGSPEEVLVTLRVQVDSCRPADLSALITILLGGTPAICSNRALWIQAVQDHFDDVPLFVSCRKLLQLVCETAPHVGREVYLVNPDGSHQSRDLVALCRGSAPFPTIGVHVFIRAKNALVSSSTADDPQLVNIDCTGLGGHDLGGFKVFVQTSTVSPFMALRWLRWSLLAEMGYTTFL